MKRAHREVGVSMRVKSLKWHGKFMCVRVTTFEVPISKAPILQGKQRKTVVALGSFPDMKV